MSQKPRATTGQALKDVGGGEAAEVVKQPAVDLKQGPERIGKGEDYGMLKISFGN